MEFIRLTTEDPARIAEMSAMATAIVKEHFDPIIGSAQNDYMISRFQTAEAISSQLEHGYQYYFVEHLHQTVGFLAFYPRGDVLYLSKFYLYKAERGQDYSRIMLDFVVNHAKAAGLTAVELNVNRGNDAIYAYEKLGFVRLREEKTDIGHGFCMDDYVYYLPVPSHVQKSNSAGHS